MSNSEQLSLENESFGINILQKIFQNMAGRVAIGASSVGAEEELISSKILASTVGIIGSPIDYDQTPKTLFFS
ncbi:hypothetical protein MFLAVUS_004938 [Mucor flavus]|uniref:Uncharacterized protein n=1 Tax=Mucor flavus TaxID=439312 RepID=A0ABP9YXC7_9FUNG